MMLAPHHPVPASVPGPPGPIPGARPSISAATLRASLPPSKWRRRGREPGARRRGNFLPEAARQRPQGRAAGGGRPPRPAPAAPGPGSCHDECGRKAPPSPRCLAASGPSSAPPLLSAAARRSDPRPRARCSPGGPGGGGIRTAPALALEWVELRSAVS